MRTIFLIVIAVLLAGASFSAGVRYEACHHHNKTAAVNPCLLSREAIEILALATNELPDSYDLIHDGPFLEGMGMSTNPDFVCNVTEMQAVAARGGIASFLAAYGTGTMPRVMVNGVFFRKQKYADDFAAFQSAKKRPVIISRKPDADGNWLLILARDPKADYSEAEQKKITAGIHQYLQRVGAEQLSDNMWTQPQPGT